MKNFNFIAETEFPFDSNIFMEMQNDYKLYEKVISQLITGVVPGTGKYILYGVEIVNQNYLSEGLLMIDGELLRFTGGAWNDQDDFLIFKNQTTESVTVSGTTYLRSSEYICTTDDTHGVWRYDEFTRIDSVVLKSFFNEKNKKVSFSPLSGISGITVHHASAVRRPFAVDVSVHFTVDISVLVNDSATININGALASLGVNPAVAGNSNRMVGNYILYHYSGANLAEQHAGIVRSNGSDTLNLNIPYTVMHQIYSPINATFLDLCAGDGVSYDKYLIELNATIKLDD